MDTLGSAEMKNPVIITQDEEFSLNLNLNTLDLEATTGENPGVDDVATIQSTSASHHEHFVQSKMISGYASNKQRELKYFQTVNHAKVIWDSKS